GAGRRAARPACRRPTSRWSRSPCSRTPRATASGSSRADRAQHPVDVVVAEQAVRVHPGAHGLEHVPLRIEPPQLGGRAVVALATVGTSLVVAHVRLDAAEIRLTLGAAVS